MIFKILVKQVVMTVFIMVVFILGLFIANMTPSYNRESIPRFGYLIDIDTPEHSKTEEYLLELNEYADQDIVIADRFIRGAGIKVIYIKEGTDFQNKPSEGKTIAGEAWWIRGIACEITIDPALEEEVYKYILIHEYLHCMGYVHHGIFYNIMEATHHDITPLSRILLNWSIYWHVQDLNERLN